jgi:hypothetical protein
MKQMASMKVRHPLLFGCLPLAILTVCLLAWIGWKGVPMYKYGQRSQRIWHRLYALKGRRPPSVSPRLWEESVGWAITAHCNVCFSEGHASYEAMCRFEEQLDEKLEGEIDLGTIEWIGDRLSETGPHGQRYMANWRLQWRELQEWGEQEAQSPHQRKAR